MNKAVARLHARQAAMDAKIANAQEARKLASKMPFEEWREKFKLGIGDYNRMSGRK